MSQALSYDAGLCLVKPVFLARVFFYNDLQSDATEVNMTINIALLCRSHLAKQTFSSKYPANSVLYTVAVVLVFYSSSHV